MTALPNHVTQSAEDRHRVEPPFARTLLATQIVLLSYDHHKISASFNLAQADSIGIRWLHRVVRNRHTLMMHRYHHSITYPGMLPEDRSHGRIGGSWQISSVCCSGYGLPYRLQR